MGGQLAHPVTGEPQTKDAKVWETVDDEYVFWEDILIDPVRQHGDVEWIAFRHLFDREEPSRRNSPRAKNFSNTSRPEQDLRSC